MHQETPCWTGNGAGASGGASGGAAERGWLAPEMSFLAGDIKRAHACHLQLCPNLLLLPRLPRSRFAYAGSTVTASTVMFRRIRALQGMLDDASELTARMLEGIVEEQGEDSEAAVRYLVG